ncbi:hypothetical protein QYF36_023903 [Acer negundo]|nr:hypothetical protein QYF36_023903 [Acer negundo]
MKLKIYKLQFRPPSSLEAGKYTAGDTVKPATVHEYLAAEILELDVVQVEDGVGSESTTGSSSSRYATITGDGAVCLQKREGDAGEECTGKRWTASVVDSEEAYDDDDDDDNDDDEEEVEELELKNL